MICLCVLSNGRSNTQCFTRHCPAPGRGEPSLTRTSALSQQNVPYRVMNAPTGDGSTGARRPSRRRCSNTCRRRVRGTEDRPVIAAEFLDGFDVVGHARSVDLPAVKRVLHDSAWLMYSFMISPPLRHNSIDSLDWWRCLSQLPGSSLTVNESIVRLVMAAFVRRMFSALRSSRCSAELLDQLAFEVVYLPATSKLPSSAPRPAEHRCRINQFPDADVDTFGRSCSS